MTDINFYTWLETHGRKHPNPAVRIIWQQFFHTIGGSRATTLDGMRRHAARWGDKTDYMLRQFDAAVDEWRLPTGSNVVSLASYRSGMRPPLPRASGWDDKPPEAA